MSYLRGRKYVFIAITFEPEDLLSKIIHGWKARHELFLILVSGQLAEKVPDHYAWWTSLTDRKMV